MFGQIATVGSFLLAIPLDEQQAINLVTCRASRSRAGSELRNLRNGNGARIAIAFAVIASGLVLNLLTVGGGPVFRRQSRTSS